MLGNLKGIRFIKSNKLNEILISAYVDEIFIEIYSVHNLYLAITLKKKNEKKKIIKSFSIYRTCHFKTEY